VVSGRQGRSTPFTEVAAAPKLGRPIIAPISLSTSTSIPSSVLLSSCRAIKCAVVNLQGDRTPVSWDAAHVQSP
jgi:hypothetical protein